MKNNWILVCAVLLMVSCQSKSQQSQVKNDVKSEQKAPESIAPVEQEPEVVSNLGPMDSIKDLDKKIESYELGESLTPEQVQKNQDLKAKIIRGTFDIRELCRLALAKHWDEITPEQRDHVVLLMSKLLEKKALFSKERLSGKDKYYNIQYLSEEIDKADAKQALVKTRLVVAKRDLKVDLQYKMILSTTGWKIFDVIVDDSSMLLNYRSAFHNIITKYGFQELENRMQKKLDEIK